MFEAPGSLGKWQETHFVLALGCMILLRGGLKKKIENAIFIFISTLTHFSEICKENIFSLMK